MSFSNKVMTEFMIPKTLGVERRLRGFYKDIGWHLRVDTDEPAFVYVGPFEGNPTVTYWQTENDRKLAHFQESGVREKAVSNWNCGIRLPFLNDLVEVTLVVPNDEAVMEIFVRGGSTIQSHTHIGPRQHSGAQEIRFRDPFNYGLRVTADPGYQVE